MPFDIRGFSTGDRLYSDQAIFSMKEPALPFYHYMQIGMEPAISFSLKNSRGRILLSLPVFEKIYNN